MLSDYVFVNAGYLFTKDHFQHRLLRFFYLLSRIPMLTKLREFERDKSIIPIAPLSFTRTHAATRKYGVYQTEIFHHVRHKF